MQLGYHTMSLMRDVTKWGRMDANGDESGYFNNEATGEIEFWQRQFSPRKWVACAMPWCAARRRPSA